MYDYVICGILLGYLLQLLVKSKKEASKLKKQLQMSLPEDLELATSEQLMDELRRRPQMKYILIMPIKSKDQQGLSVEIHGVPPDVSVAVLQAATFVTTKELRDRGHEIPDMPGMSEMDDMPPDVDCFQ